MNPTEEQLPAPPQPPQPHRNSTSCERHPDEHFTGFCPSCLCERLAVLDHSASASTSSGRKSASSALKSIFRVSGNAASSGGNGNAAALRNSKPNGSFLPELRRTKSFSGGKNDGFGFSGIFEPQRKSCDVRVRSTLWSLFYHDDEKRTVVVRPSNGDINGSSCGNSRPMSSSYPLPPAPPLLLPSTAGIVVESKEEEEEEEEEVVEEDDVQLEFEPEEENDELLADSDEIQVIEEPILSNSSNTFCSGEQLGVGLPISDELKPMKDHIDVESQNKKTSSKDLKEIAGSFWSAASVFSKKFRAWARKHPKMKKHSGRHAIQDGQDKRGRSNGRSRKGNALKSKSYNYRDTQSEIADYGFGRRSCDTDPRFSLDAGRMSLDAGRMSLDAGRMSLDAGRMSFDDPRYSFDEPRASWDGYLIGRSFPRMPPMVSVVEDPPPVIVQRKDNQIPLEDQPRSSISINGECEEEGNLPGGAAQTKDYYSDSSSRRRKSLDRSSSIRKTAAAVVAEMDEMKSAIPNGAAAKVSPATTDNFHGPKITVGDSNSNSLRENGSENCEVKKSRGWRAWNIWGLIYRRNGNKEDDDDRYSRANGVERSFSESWEELRKGGDYGIDPRGAFNRNVFRSNSSVSWRNSYSIGGSLGNRTENGKKKKEEFVLERNRSARYSPSHGENGLLRFYLTPMRGSRRGGSAKAKPTYTHSFARSVLRMY